MRLQGDYNATSWPQLAKPDLAFGQPSWVGAECGKSMDEEDEEEDTYMSHCDPYIYTVFMFSFYFSWYTLYIMYTCIPILF